MKAERLQEIKEVNRTRAGNLWSISIIKELVTALEASQAELVFCVKQAKDYLEQHEKLRELLESKDAQLDEAQKCLKASVELCNIREEQLQAEIAEVERLRECKNDLIWHEKKVYELEAEVKRLRKLSPVTTATGWIAR